MHYFFSRLFHFFMMKEVHESNLCDYIWCIFFRDDLVGWMSFEHRLEDIVVLILTLIAKLLLVQVTSHI